MIARMALPRLGGAPAVWNSAMLVYQLLLLGGYAYAHWLGRFTPRTQGAIHLTLLLAAATMLPIGLIASNPSPDANIFLWVPWLLLVSIGPLFLAVSAQAPLIQRWYAIRGAAIPIRSMPRQISAVSAGCLPIRCWSSRCSRSPRRVLPGAWAMASCWPWLPPAS